MYGPPNKRQKRENKGGLGSPLGSPVKCRCKETPEAAYRAITETIVSNKKMHQQIVNWYDASFESHDVTVKTFLIRFWDTVTSLDSCSENLLRKYFMYYETFVEDLCNLSIKDCTSMDIHLITVSLLRQNYQDEQIISMLRQLKYIFRTAKIMGLYTRNPVIDVLAEYTEHQVLLQQLRNALVLRSLSLEENKRLLRILEKHMTTEPGLVIGTMIRWLTGMKSREVAPLVWGDIIHLKSVDILQILVYKEFASRGTTAREMTYDDLYRVVPCCLLLRENIERYREEMRKIVDETDDEAFAKIPVVTLASKPGESITPERLTKFGNQIRKELGIEERILEATNSKGERVTIDLSKSKSDWLRTNYDYQARQVVYYLDDVNYAMGRRLKTTAARHYRDYTKPSRQLAYSVSIDTWAETLRDGSMNVDTGLRIVEIRAERESVKIQKTCLPTENEVLIRVPKGSPEEELKMYIFIRFGGTIVAYEKSKGR